MSVAVVQGFYSLSYEENQARAIVNLREQIRSLKNTQSQNTNSENKTTSTEIKDEYIPSSQPNSSDQQSSSVYKKPNSNGYRSPTDPTAYLYELFPMEDQQETYKGYMWTRALLHCDLSAVDIASSDYGQKTIEINGGKTISDLTTVNGEPKIYSLDEIYRYVKDDPDTIIMYEVVKPSLNQTVPKEVEKLGDWYVEHWNEISLSYVSNEGKIVSTEDKELTREEEMKLYALKSAVLAKQLWANEKTEIKKEDYRIRDSLSLTNGRSAKLTGVPDTSFLFK